MNLKKRNAHAGNRIRVTCMASMYHTTRPRALHEIPKMNVSILIANNKIYFVSSKEKFYNEIKCFLKL